MAAGGSIPADAAVLYLAGPTESVRWNEFCPSDLLDRVGRGSGETDWDL